MSAIKGSAIESVIDDVNRLVAEGRVSRDELEARLEKPDLALLETKVQAAGWYPLGSYGRMSELLKEVDGGGRDAYVVARGRAAAERLRGTGMYSQLSADRDRWGSRLGAMMTTIGPAMFKDTSWEYVEGTEEGTYCIRVRVDAAFPETGRLAAQGFISYLADIASPGLAELSSRRLSATEVVFESRRS